MGNRTQKSGNLLYKTEKAWYGDLVRGNISASVFDLLQMI